MDDAIPLRTWLAYLDWEGSCDQAMSAMELDGFMAGLAVTPSFSPTQPWRSEVWGTGGPVPFRDERHMREVVDGLAHFYHDVRSAIAVGVPHYSPLCLPIEGEPDIWELRIWATGFMLGMEYDPDYWRALVADKRGEFVTLPIMAFFPDANGHYHDPAGATELEAVPVMAKSIARAVCTLWTMSGQKTAATTKVGRNDRCPCGSGKKYKRCCGG